MTNTSVSKNSSTVSKEETYNPRDILLIEVQPFISNFYFGNQETQQPVHVPHDRVSKIEILALQLDEFKTQLEDDLASWERAEARYQRAKEKFISEEVARHQQSNPTFEVTPLVKQKIETAFRLFGKHSPANYFFQETGRTLKPIKYLKVLKNLGPRAGDTETQLQNRKDMDDLMKEALLKFLQSQTNQGTDKNNK